MGQVDIPDASLTVKGKVQLSSATDSAAEDRAATPKAVKAAYDLADQAFQVGNERKKEVVDALVALGVSASINDSWATLISKMATVIKATGNAAVGDVLAGKTFSNDGANGLTGTMPNQGARTITPGTANQSIAAGYHNGSGYVKGDANLIAGNIPKDKTIFGVTGNLERLTTADKTAIATQITNKGVVASVNDTPALLATKIGQIVTGKRYEHGITEYPSAISAETVHTVTGMSFTPSMVVAKIYQKGSTYDEYVLYISTIPRHIPGTSERTGLVYGITGDKADFLTNVMSWYRYGVITNGGFKFVFPFSGGGGPGYVVETYAYE
jgi:hypothetical protein